MRYSEFCALKCILIHSLISERLQYSLVNYTYSALNNFLLSEEKKNPRTWHLLYLNLYLTYDQHSFQQLKRWHILLFKLKLSFVLTDLSRFTMLSTQFRSVPCPLILKCDTIFTLQFVVLDYLVLTDISIKNLPLILQISFFMN